VKKLIKAIFIDFSGVISQHGCLFEPMLEFFPDEITAKQSKELFNAAKIGKMSNKEYISKYSDEAWNWYFKKTAEHEGLMSFLTKNTLPLFIASNQVSDLIQKEIDILGVREYFTDIFISDKLELAKPRKEFYEEVLKRAGFEAKESIFVDDQKRNLVVPKEMGMTTVWVNNTKVDPFGDNDEVTPDFSIYKIDELLEIIKKLNQPNH